MTRKIFLPLLVAVCVAVLTGCQTTKAASPSVGGTAAESVRNNCYSLLHQLLEEQKDVSLLRFIKREHSDVKELVKRIAAASGAGSKRLEEFARQDPSLKLDDIWLPTGELATRDAIATTKKKEILGKSGDEFELTLLLTQSEALNYAWHLAKVAAENDPQPERARALTDLGAEMRRLYREVFLLILSKQSPSGDKK